MKARYLRLILVPLLCILAGGPAGPSNNARAQIWTEPEPLSEINTELHDKAAFQSFDGLTLYFSVSPEVGYTHIWQATRPRPAGPFGLVQEISALNNPVGQVDYPWVSADNLRMYYYYSDWNWRRLAVTKRPSSHGWGAAWAPGDDIDELNQLGQAANPTLTKDERTIVFSGDNGYSMSAGQGGWDLWMAHRPDRSAPFGNVTNLNVLNSAAWDMHPSIAPDGLTLYFTSTRNGPFQILKSTRSSLNSAFDPPEHLARFDTPGGDSCYPSISPDGKTFYYGRWENGKDMDLYAAYALHWPLAPARSAKLVSGRDANNVTVCDTIQEAISAASRGDVVKLVPGLYREAIDLAGKAITIESGAEAAILEAPAEVAVAFGPGAGPETVLRNVIIRNSLVAVQIPGGSPTITNVTVVGNKYGIAAFGNAKPRISNCILWDNSERDLSGCQATYSCIERWAEGEGNFSEDPLFADAVHGDYHLLSSWGRYRPEYDVWVLDEVTSPCIDAGDPAADCSAEPTANGGRINVGAHGGTAFASRSEPPFSLDATGDDVIDINDLETYMDLWEAQVPTP